MTDLPVYNNLHGGHPDNSKEHATVGFDVVRTDWSGPVTIVEVVETIDGATSYMAALEAAKKLRHALHGWAFPAARYACGCRWVATAITGDVKFIDLAPLQLVVRIDNEYADGHRSAVTFQPACNEPDPTDPAAMEAFWDDWVWPETGDGHTGDACYTATITAAANHALVGLSNEWVG